MSTSTKTIIGILAGATGLAVLLYIAPKTLDNGHEGHDHANETASADLSVFVQATEKKMPPSEKAKYDFWRKQNQFDSLMSFWTLNKRPDLAAFFAEAKANKSQIAQDWSLAGERYYNAARFVTDNTELPSVYQSGIRCLRAAISKGDKESKTKIVLASCYVEGTENPMEGISLLREVEKTDSNNVQLQLAFAGFSMKSGQTDKAVKRFNNVLRIDSNYIEAYLYLADAYEQQSDTLNTIKMLEAYALKTNDLTSRMEVKKYIEELKLK
jgi:tetratricopeptide (TPR) repeat protein